jgi:GT2 family glycosyltransferase
MSHGCQTLFYYFHYLFGISMMKFLLITSTYNRVKYTKKCLILLREMVDSSEFSFSLLVVDNNSTDGTLAEVNSIFPEGTVILTPKDMYWAQSMRFGYAYAEIYRFDAVIVFNDDIEINPTVGTEMVRYFADKVKIDPNYCLIGSFRDSDGNHTYGGQKINKNNIRIFTTPIIADEQFEFAHTLNMNFAIIPSKLLDRVGFLQDYFIHRGADTEWGIRARNEGAQLAVYPAYVGECQRNSFVGTSRDKSLPFFHRLSLVFGPKEFPIRERYLFLREHGPRIWFFELFAPYLRFLVRYFDD